MINRLLPIFLCLTLVGCRNIQRETATPTATEPKAAVLSGPWNMRELGKTPPATWGPRGNFVQEVYYDGEALGGKPTRVFAYVGRPNGSGPFPGVVLVHGGGGKAFLEWADHWAKRGYVSIAMDTSGNGPSGRLPEGGPDQDDKTKFRNFTAEETREMWTYHAVAAVIRAHSLLLSMPEVDRKRTAITGISWGGYLTCIVAGLDHRFKAAVPVYGSGFLGENSVWKNSSLARMDPEARALWLKTFDPSNYLMNVRCPILFFNGTHDFAYPLDSYQTSYNLVDPKLRHISIVMNLPHGHIWTFPEPEAFIDQIVAQQRFPRLAPLRYADGVFTTESTHPIKEAHLIFTQDSGPWDKRAWTTLPANVNGKSIQRRFPAQPPPTAALITATVADDRSVGATNTAGLRISTDYISIAE